MPAEGYLVTFPAIAFRKKKENEFKKVVPIGEDPATHGHWCTFSDFYHAMGVLPSTQPLDALGSSFILSSFDVACTCCVPYVEDTVFGVGMNVGCDDCNCSH